VKKKNENSTIQVIINNNILSDDKNDVFSINCDIYRVGKNSRRPLPESTPQLKKQFYYFEGDFVRVLTPYVLDENLGEEKTTINLLSGKVETRLSYSDNLNGKVLTYG